MPTFGFSAFLKMLSLSARRQRSEMRTRLSPSDGGYDFHRGFRRLAHRYLAEGEELEPLLLEAAAITNPAEGRSAVAALQYLRDWQEDHPIDPTTLQPRSYESPSKRFKVKFTPDFGIKIGDIRVSIHIWNTKIPSLDARMTYAALSLFAELYEDEVDGPLDLAVLSVPDNRLYRLSDVPNPAVLAARVVALVEALVEEIGDEIRRPSFPPGPDQPGR